MYPRNAVSPERIAVGQVVLIADGTVQSAGVAITVRGQGAAEAAGAGTIAYGADNTVYYTPTQAETNYTSFVVIAYKASCFSASQTIITTASVTPGQVRLEGVTHTGAVIPTVSALTGHTAQTGDTYALANGASGFVAIDTVVDTLLSRIIGTLAAGTHNAQSGDSFARLGAPAGASIAADLVVIDNFVDELESRLTALRAGYLDNLSGGAVSLASELAKVPKSDGVVTWNATALASINTQADTALTDFFTSVASLVDAIYDENITTHLSANSAGLYLALAGGIIVDTTLVGTPTATSIQFTGGSAVANFYRDQIAEIISGTGTLQAKPILSSSYSGGTTTLNFDENLVVIPASGDRLVIKFTHVHPISTITSHIDANSTQLASLVATLGTAGAGLTNLGGMSATMKAQVLTEVVKLLTTTMVESYAADGAAPTMTQALMLIQQALTEFAIVATAYNIKKLDGTTVAATLTLDSASAPTATTRTA